MLQKVILHSPYFTIGVHQSYVSVQTGYWNMTRYRANVVENKMNNGAGMIKSLKDVQRRRDYYT